MPWTQLRQIARERLRRIDGAYRSATASMRALPDFLIIGEAKCGTTSLYDDLVQHPCVREAAIKEVHFFDLRFHRGLDWYRAQFPFVSLLGTNPNGRRSQTGEASPYYMFHPHAPARIKATLPDVKLIAILRNPVERAYSHYQHEYRHKRETLTFEEAIARESERLDGELERMIENPCYNSRAHRRHAYVTRGIYVESLRRMMSLFSREQLLVVCSKEFFHNPQPVYRQITSFLELPEDINHRFAKRNTGSYAPIAPATRRHLQQYYEPHNKRLYALLGRDFQWE